MQRAHAIVALMSAFAVAPATLGQGSISDGPGVVFTWTVFGGSAALTDFEVAGHDHSFQSDWFYRIGGETSETSFGVPATESYTPNDATHVYSFASFDAIVETVITDLGVNQAEVVHEMIITNTSGATLDLALFHYHDIDLGGTFANDTATGGIGGIQLTDGGSDDEATYTGDAADAFQVAPLPEIRDALNDEAVTDLDGSGVPLGPADLAAAFQWNLEIAPGGQAPITVTIVVIGDQAICQDGAGDCFDPNGTPGCEVEDCCSLVCAVDPTCCEMSWDQGCADQAASLCVDPSCPGDTNGDSDVDVEDLVNVLLDWGCTGVCTGDVTVDGKVNVEDLVVVITSWGPCP
jgi:hypothetical protein